MGLLYDLAFFVFFILHLLKNFSSLIILNLNRNISLWRIFISSLSDHIAFFTIFEFFRYISFFIIGMLHTYVFCQHFFVGTVFGFGNGNGLHKLYLRNLFTLHPVLFKRNIFAIFIPVYAQV